MSLTIGYSIASMDGDRKLEKRPANRALNPQQEEMVLQWLCELDEASQAPTLRELRSHGNLILQRDHTDSTAPPRTLGKMWASHFMQRLPEEYRHLKTRPEDPRRSGGGRRPKSTATLEQSENETMPNPEPEAPAEDQNAEENNNNTSTPPSSDALSSEIVQHLKQKINIARKALDDVADILDAISPELRQRLETELAV